MTTLSTLIWPRITRCRVRFAVVQNDFGIDPLTAFINAKDRLFILNATKLQFVEASAWARLAKVTFINLDHACEGSHFLL